MEPEDDDGWVFPYKQAYHSYIVHLMAWFHAVVYLANATFTRAQLLELTPLTIKRWLQDLAYGDPDPGPDARPTLARSSTLEFAKKAVSFYMPNKGPPWMHGVGGNPTKSPTVNEVIKEVKKHEVRGEGSPSNAKRPLREPEFRKTLELFRVLPDWVHRFKYPLMCLIQYHLIGRVDDTSELKVVDPRGHPRFPFALKLKVRWSKNVLEERNCPDQILLASNDSAFCVQIAMAQYLEIMLERHPTSVYLFTDSDSNNAVKNIIAQFRSRLKAVVWSHDDFKDLEDEDDDEGLGTHSQRKFPATKAKAGGANNDEVEIRGRWKTGRGRIVTIYIDVKQEYIDAKVAAILCVGGPIAYKLKEGVNITDDWLFEHVVPNIRARYRNDRRLCRLLGLALLYVACDPELGFKLPNAIVNRISTAYAQINVDEIDQPVEKIALTIYRVEDNLHISENNAVNPPPPGPGIGGGGVGGGGGNGITQEQYQHLLLQIHNTNQQVHSSNQQQMGALQSHRTHVDNQFRTLNNNVRRYGGTIQGAMGRQANQGARRQDAANQRLANIEGDAPGSATLSRAPRELITLWEEYIHGIGGRKPAQQFTSAERNNRRGGTKQKYYRRKVVWDVIAGMVRAGHSPQAACHAIRQVYGFRKSVTQIITFLKSDKRNNRMPEALQ